jgi:hypothetical protein
MSGQECPYGDGRAAARIATALSRWLDGQQLVLYDSEQFQMSGTKARIAV